MEKGYFVCVDDELAVIDTLQEQLREEFGKTHEIEIADSAEKAINLIDDIEDSGGLIEVIITDQVMPGMKGDQFLEIINERNPDCIKILLTGQAGLDNAIHAINRGGLNRYVEKPWNRDHLMADIEELIDKFRQNIENQRLFNSLERKIANLEEENRDLRSRLDD